MANKFNAIGLKPIDSIVASEFNGQTNKYYVPTSDATDIWVNDVVKLTGNSNSAGIPIVAKAAAGEESVGTIVAVKSIHDNENFVYRKAGEERILYVADDPWTEFEVQVNGTITTADVGKQADIVVAGGNAAAGISGTQLDLTTLTTNPAQLKILGILEKEGNEFGLYTHVRCIIAEHELKDVGSVTQVLWKLVGNTIVPFNANNNLDIRNGNFSCIDFAAEGLSVLSAGQVQSTAQATVADSFVMSVVANAGATTNLNAGIDKVVSFPEGVFSTTSQGEFYNIGAGSWTFAGVGAATIVYDDIATPLQTGEHAFWRKVDTNKYLIIRKRIDRSYPLLAANYDPSVLTDDTTIPVDNTAAARNVIISAQDIASGSPTLPRTFYIPDVLGQAGANNITVSLKTGNINGAANFVLNANYASVILKVNGTNGQIY